MEKTYKAKPATELAKLTKANGGLGWSEKSNEEVQGKGMIWLVRCHNCGTINRVDSDWDFFVCRCCVSANWK